MPFSGTRAYTDNTLKRHQAEFRDFKEQVRRTFDLPMLRRVFPVGTLLRDVIVEQQGNPSFGRQMGSYPILVGFPILLKAGTVVDAAVVDYGMRSLSALPVPVEINRIPPGALAWIPGIGKKRSGLLAARRPFRNLDEFRAAAGDTPLDSYLSF